MILRTSGLAALVFLSILSAPARAQVGFQPVVEAFPNGVTLSVTPVVSADRRYVRLGMNPQFTGLEGFDAYSIPLAVTGGGAGAGGGLRSVGAPGMAFGMDGPVGPDSYGYGYGNGYGYGPGLLPTPSPGASSFLAGGAGYPGPPRLGVVTAERPRTKAAARKTTRLKKGRVSR